MDALLVDKYNEEKAMAKDVGKSNVDVEFRAKKMPEVLAVQKWLDNYAEISLKKAIEQMVGT